MQKSFCESFNGRMRDELLNESFGLDQARETIARWIADYNQRRTALGARLHPAGRLRRQSHRNARASGRPRPARPPAHCSVPAGRSKIRRGSHRRWMKVQWHVTMPKIEQPRPDRLDGRAHACALVAAQIVHHDDVASFQSRREELRDIGLEAVAVDRAVERHRRDHSRQAQRGDERRGLPVSVRNAAAQSFASRSAATAARHVGRSPCLVEAHVSSMNARRCGSRSRWVSLHAWRRFTRSGRSCSAACAVFFST